MVLLIAKNFQLVKFSQADFEINKPLPTEVDEGNWNQVQLSRLWKSNSVGDLVNQTDVVFLCGAVLLVLQ